MVLALALLEKGDVGSPLLAVNNDLQAMASPEGHGDSF